MARSPAAGRLPAQPALLPPSLGGSTGNSGKNLLSQELAGRSPGGQGDDGSATREVSRKDVNLRPHLPEKEFSVLPFL